MPAYGWVILGAVLLLVLRGRAAAAPFSLGGDVSLRLRQWADAVAHAEGWYEGSVSWSNNNPGNVKGLSGQFLVFGSAADGFAYLQDYLYRAATGQHAAYSPDMTLLEMAHIYTGEDKAAAWASIVSADLGVTPDTSLAAILEG